MKKTVIKFFVMACAAIQLSSVSAQQIPFPQPSPTATVSQNFATSKIELSYSRPGAKGRKVFGDVVPFGQVWRTGANGATTISFGDDVKLNGMEVKAGKYGLLTIPGQSEWTIIITKDLTVTNASAYKQENDVVRLKVNPVSVATPVETFTIEVANMKSNEADVVLKWENTTVSFKVSADIDAKLNKMIDETMAKDSRPYFQSANFYYENGKDLNKALEWVNKAADANPDAYWVLHLKAKIQKGLKDYNGAVASATASMEKAKTGGDDAYVKNNEKLLTEIKALPDYKEVAPAKKKK
jgi:hypothetical protein